MGRLIQPGKTWQDDAKRLTAQAIQDGASHKVTDHYKSDEVRAALEELFHNKCAYCEERLPSPFDVEHYRPKGRVKENPNHPGYYWLAYKWENLYPSCQPCNRRLNDKPSWDDSSTSTGGKLDQFPLAKESRRCFTPTERLWKEDPLLLDPCNSKQLPEDHFYYTATGEPAVVDSSPYGIATIEVCHLTRKRHKRQVRERLGELKSLLELREELTVDKRATLDQFLQKEYLADNCLFAGACRAAYQDRALLGL